MYGQATTTRYNIITVYNNNYIDIFAVVSRDYTHLIILFNRGLKQTDRKKEQRVQIYF